MNSLHLVVFECASIQEYVFASNRLKEAVGASYIIGQVLENVLVNFLDEYFDHVISNWEDDKDKPLQIVSDSTIQAEVVYMAGGNAVIALQSEDKAISLVRNFSLHCHINYPGVLLNAGIAPLSPDFKISLKNAFTALQKNKNRLSSFGGLSGIGVTRECATTGLPATDKQKEHEAGNSWVSKTSAVKRGCSSDANQQKHKQLLTSEQQEYCAFPLELKELGQREGESHIAVVHIDGNGIGKLLQENSRSVEAIRKFAVTTKELFEGMIQHGIDKVMPFMHQAIFEPDDGKYALLIRPFIWGGDDITFICDGRLGIPLASTMLKYLYDNQDENSPSYISACAGVAITKTAFPISRAYQLSEELCQKAKNETKSKQLKNKEKFWLDFQIVPAGLTGSLDNIRNQVDKELYFRPWSVCVQNEVRQRRNKKHSWERFKRILDMLSPENNWSRSRIKAFREALVEGGAALKLFLEKAKFRNCTIDYPVQSSDDTPYFDVIEAMDYFVDLDKPPEPRTEEKENV